MNNTAINTLMYTGLVTISQYRGSKKVELLQSHNSGANPLFNFLSDCLVGNFDTANRNMPTKIRLLVKEKDQNGNVISNRYTAATRDFIYLTTNPEKMSSSSQGELQSDVRYSFKISKDMIIEENFDGIGLYTDSAEDINNFAAYCNVTQDELRVAGLSASSVLVVDWLLTISNKDGDL